MYTQLDTSVAATT